LGGGKKKKGEKGGRHDRGEVKNCEVQNGKLKRKERFGTRRFAALRVDPGGGFKAGKVKKWLGKKDPEVKKEESEKITAEGGDSNADVGPKKSHGRVSKEKSREKKRPVGSKSGTGKKLLPVGGGI